MDSPQSRRWALAVIIGLVLAGLIGHLLLAAACPAPERARPACPDVSQAAGELDPGTCALHAGFQAPLAIPLSLPLALVLLALVWPRPRDPETPRFAFFRPPVALSA